MQHLADAGVGGMTLDMAGSMLLGDSHCCNGCLPRHTIHHLPQSQQQEHHILTEQQHLHSTHQQHHQDGHSLHVAHHSGMPSSRVVGSDSSMEGKVFILLHSQHICSKRNCILDEKYKRYNYFYLFFFICISSSLFKCIFLSRSK